MFKQEFDKVWTAGLGAVTPSTMIMTPIWPTDLISNVLIANIPQLVFSVLYFMSNSVLTNMTLAGEWDNLALERKGLRVSTRPRGNQRSTHFLSLPWRFAIPLIIHSALLHWLLSQSLFFVRIVAYTPDGRLDRSYDTVTVGYSPLAIVIGLAVGLVLPAGLIFLGSRRFKSGMPVAGSCSLAISAACHPSLKDKDREGIECRLLQWGVEVRGNEEGWHCGFSDREVAEPQDGMVYQ